LGDGLALQAVGQNPEEGAARQTATVQAGASRHQPRPFTPHANIEAGIAFADALHHASYKSCDSVATFDDRKFARRARKLGLAPAVMVLA
jgi:hypothetical protein